MIVGGIDLSKRYHIDDIFKMRRDGRLQNIALAGYVVRSEDNGMISFVPWHQSTFAARKAAGGDRQYDITADAEKMREDVEREFPMVRRTPQQRVASMVVRMMAEAKRNGTIAGLTDAQIRTITGEAWLTGESQVTEAMVRKVVAHFLGVAEVDNREADSKRTTRAHQFA